MTATVLLPQLHQVQIKNIPLYSTTVTLDLRPGLNVVLGANGLGKTTTVKLALVGILGRVASDDAVSNIVKEATKRPSVDVRFGVGTQEFRVTRDLKTHLTTSFSLVNADGEITLHEDQQPNAEYIRTLLGATNAGSLENLYFLLSRLVFREEEAAHILWEPETQHKILRLLFSGGNFEQEWNVTFDRSRNADTKYRQHKEFLRRDEVARARLAERLTHARENLGLVLGRQSHHGRSLMDIRQEISDMEAKKKRLEDTILEINQEIEPLRGTRQQRALRRDRAQSELLGLEASLHERVFREYSVLGMVARRLRHQHLCVFCHQDVEEGVVQQLLETKITLDQCPLCEQALKSNAHPEIDRRKLEESSSTVETLTLAVTEIDKKLSNLNRILGRYRDQMVTVQRQLHDLREEYVTSSEHSPGGDPTQLEEQVRQLEGALLSLTTARTTERDLLAGLEEARSTSRAELNALEANLQSTIANKESRLAALFERFTLSLVGRVVRLELKKSKKRGEQFGYHIFHPILDERPRQRPGDTATHERFLLDYAFRMAALSFYSEQTRQPAFFAIEPAEGAMDPVYADHLAKTLFDFSQPKLGNTVLVITNLRSIPFLKGLYGDLSSDECLNRTVNFFTYGNLKGPQSKEIDKYREVWRGVFGKEMET